jgi:hypothetical protein
MRNHKGGYVEEATEVPVPGPEDKLAIVIDRALSGGLVANTAAVLAMSLGSRLESVIGPDLKDADGSLHRGITTLPIPVLVADQDEVKQLRRRAHDSADDILLVDFTDCAQRSRTYDDYTERLAASGEEELSYLGIALFGPRKAIQKLTGSLPLLR